MKIRIVFIFIIVFNFILSEERSWNTTPFDRLWNKTVHPMMFRDPIIITPFDIRIGQTYWGGEDYWNSFKLTQPFGEQGSNGQNGFITDNTDERFDNIADPSVRKSLFFAVDIAKTNITNLIYHQNVIDIQFGLGYKLNQMLTEVELDDGWRNIESVTSIPQSGTLKFKPKFQDYNFNTTITFQRSPTYLMYLNHSIGYVTSSLYQTVGGDSYLDGDGVAESFGWGLKYIGDNDNKRFSFNWGFESQWQKIFIPELNDPDNISPISKVDLRSFGILFTFSANVGGVSTIGDKAFRTLMNDDFVNSAIEFEQFLEKYPKHGKKDKAEKMLDFCYEQIPYQRFREGLKDLNVNNYDRAIKLLDMAQADANENLKFEINSRLSEIANSLLDSVLNNYQIMGYESAENLVQKAIEISPKTRFRGDKVLAKIYFEQGNILFKIGNYEKALEKFSFAQRLDPDMGNLLNVKRKDLAFGFINDASKATDVESIYLVIESLKSAIKMEPELAIDMENIVKELEKRLEEMDKREVQKIIDDIVNIDRRPNENLNKKKLELGLLPHEVIEILGEPDNVDTITGADGTRYDMWSYKKSDLTKRLYFEDLFLIRMEEE
tara:strand:+ start:5099 stop:6916 length:1818 start_codon:yes stop_codon:yes gene_type:complete